MSYSKGPWRKGIGNSVRAGGITISQRSAPQFDGETEVNAKLIASAPAMYEALKELVHCLYEWEEYDDTVLPLWEKAIAAIQQAEGRE